MSYDADAFDRRILAERCPPRRGDFVPPRQTPKPHRTYPPNIHVVGRCRCRGCLAVEADIRRCLCLVRAAITPAPPKDPR